MALPPGFWKLAWVAGRRIVGSQLIGRAIAQSAASLTAASVGGGTAAVTVGSSSTAAAAAAAAAAATTAVTATAVTAATTGAATAATAAVSGAATTAAVGTAATTAGIGAVLLAPNPIQVFVLLIAAVVTSVLPKRRGLKSKRKNAHMSRKMALQGGGHVKKREPMAAKNNDFATTPRTVASSSSSAAFGDTEEEISTFVFNPNSSSPDPLHQVGVSLALPGHGDLVNTPLLHAQAEPTTTLGAAADTNLFLGGANGPFSHFSPAVLLALCCFFFACGRRLLAKRFAENKTKEGVDASGNLTCLSGSATTPTLAAEEDGSWGEGVGDVSPLPAVRNEQRGAALGNDDGDGKDSEDDDDHTPCGVEDWVGKTPSGTPVRKKGPLDGRIDGLINLFSPLPPQNTATLQNSYNSPTRTNDGLINLFSPPPQTATLQNSYNSPARAKFASEPLPRSPPTFGGLLVDPGHTQQGFARDGPWASPVGCASPVSSSPRGEADPPASPFSSSSAISTLSAEANTHGSRSPPEELPTTQAVDKVVAAAVDAFPGAPSWKQRILGIKAAKKKAASTSWVAPVKATTATKNGASEGNGQASSSSASSDSVLTPPPSPPSSPPWTRVSKLSSMSELLRNGGGGVVSPPWKQGDSKLSSLNFVPPESSGQVKEEVGGRIRPVAQRYIAAVKDSANR